MFQRISLVIALTATVVGAFAQVKTSEKPLLNVKPTNSNKPAIVLSPQTQPQPVAQPKPLNFKKINGQLEYVIVSDKPTSPRPQEGDVIKLHMISVSNNRVVYSTRQANKNKPAEFSVNKPTFAGDIIRAIQLMTPGDSMVCQVDAENLYSNTKNKMPDFIKKGDKIQYYMKLVSIKTKAQLLKEQEVAQKKQQTEMNKKFQAQMAKQQKEAEKLIGKEDATLTEYFTKNNLTPTKTASGLYYIINEKGEGNLPVTGDTAVMNYTGRLIDGKAFDSNTDSVFNHVAPFEFPLGQGRVIKGWDEGVALLPKGSKATFYIPSRLGYGPNAQAKIPANSILFFNVELLDIKSKSQSK